MTWRDFWNTDHSIYVNARHRTLHYDGIAKDIGALIPSSAAVVLDHGCGDALAADRVAAGCARLYLFDAAPNVQARLRQQFLGAAKITVLDDDTLHTLLDASLDMVVCNSVLQYLSVGVFERLLDFWGQKLRPGGRLVIADVIADDAHAAQDIEALLRFAARGGFLFAALRGLAATFFSSYRKLRAEIGLTAYAEVDMIRLLADHGFDGAPVTHNIGHNQSRRTFVAERLVLARPIDLDD